jgi:hypothetical protein
MSIGPWEVLWIVCGLATLIAGVMATRGRRWRYLGRIAVGVLFLVGGATFNFITLVFGEGYEEFADDAHFGWVSEAWGSVVTPNQGLFIGLLIAFEAIVGLLVLSGGRRTQVGYVAVIAFYSALWVFGWFTTVWAALMIPFMILLLRAERHATTQPTPAPEIEEKALADVGSQP